MTTLVEYAAERAIGVGVVRACSHEPEWATRFAGLQHGPQTLRFFNTAEPARNDTVLGPATQLLHISGSESLDRGTYWVPGQGAG